MNFNKLSKKELMNIITNCIDYRNDDIIKILFSCSREELLKYFGPHGPCYILFCAMHRPYMYAIRNKLGLKRSAVTEIDSMFNPMSYKYARLKAETKYNKLRFILAEMERVYNLKYTTPEFL